MNNPRIRAAGLLAAVAAVGLAVGHPAQAAGDPVFGDWITAEGDAKVHVGPCAANPALTCGKLFWLKAGPAVRDINNPDPALKGRALVGVVLVGDLKREAAGRWTDGKVYAAKTGRTSRANMSINPDGTLKVEGCMAMLCQARTWTKLN